MSLQAGIKLGNRYEVVRAITSGGMGSIYEARDLQNQGRRVAVKQMLAQLMEGEQAAMFRSKFEAEVNFLRNLKHPGIPRAYDSFVLEGVYYMVMEFIIGRNLEQELEERMQLTGQAFSVDQIVRDTRQVLDILTYLHSQNPPLLHRDIKPANLIREHPSGRIRLVDFGMARVLSDPNKTQTQLGTLGYSPLEQLQGKAEQRSDIYALGATLHHLVTGVVPNVLNIPPVMQLKPSLDPALAAIIDRACASDIQFRFSSAQEMLRALDELRPHLPLTAEPSVVLSSLPRIDEPSHSSTASPALKEIPMEPEGTLNSGNLPAPTTPSPFLQPEGTVTAHLKPSPQSSEPPPAAPPSVPLNEGEETLQMGAPPRRPPGPKLSLQQQVGAIALLSLMAFVFGWGVGHRPEEESTASPSPGTTASATPTQPEVTSSPVAMQVTTPTPSPVATLPPIQRPDTRPTPKATPKPPPKPKPPPEPEETPESFPLSTGPSYPTASRPGAGDHESLSLMGTTSRVELNLDTSWQPLGRGQSRSDFFRSYRKSAGNFEINLDLKGYLMENPAEKYRNSFKTDHSGWSTASMPGTDTAFQKGQGRSQNFEALIIKPGHYYFISLRGNGQGMNSQVFQDELQRVWESVSVID